MSPQRPRVVAAAALASLLLFTPLIALPAAAGQLGEPASPAMESISSLYDQVFWIALFVFVFVEGLLLFVLWRFRKGSGHGEHTDEDERHNTAIEVVWTAIPAIILIYIGIISFGSLMEIEAKPDEVGAEITVIGHQWFWEVDYGDGVAVDQLPGPQGELDDVEPFLIPVNTNVTVTVTSADSQHALWIPRLGVKLDAYPGINNTISFRATEEGEYFSQCAEFCGFAHSYMRALWKAVPQDEFDAWIRSQKAGAAPGVTYEFSVTDGAIEPGSRELVQGIPANLRFKNDGSAPVEVVVGGIEDGSTGEVAPGASGWVNFTADAAGTLDVTVSGDDTRTASIEVIEAVNLEVELGAFEIDPGPLEFEAGTTYVIEVTNTHSVAHNLFIGDREARELFVESTNLGPGESEQIVVTFDQAGEFEAWCDIAGHYQAGMHVPTTVS